MVSTTADMKKTSLYFSFSSFFILALTKGIGPSCDEVVQTVAKADLRTELLFPPPLAGTWVSERCEVRAGPEYLLRWHYYSENGTFSHNTFVYLDEGCSRPVWSRCVKGRYGLRGKSWLMAGASQADFTLQEVMVIVYSGTMAQDLSARANTSCPGVVVGQWMPEVEYIVYKHQEKNDSSPPSREEVDRERSCMALLKLSYEDVGLLRIQRRPQSTYDNWGEREELLLGETKAKVTVFADPLIRANQTASCVPCQQVHKSTLLYPPILDLKPSLPLHLTGEWVSIRCEIKHHGLFLRRRLRVSGKSWHAEYWFFSDPKCTLPTLLAAAEGNYAAAGSKVVSKVKGASDFDFHVERAFLTVFEKGLAESLQEDGKCGPPGEWQVGIARDLTSSGGCPALGITIPTTEYELIRLEADPSDNALLFLGQSEERKGEKKERPTHFQPPLIQCATPEFPLTHFLNSFNSGPLRAAGALPLLPVLLFV